MVTLSSQILFVILLSPFATKPFYVETVESSVSPTFGTWTTEKGGTGKPTRTLELDWSSNMSPFPVTNVGSWFAKFSLGTISCCQVRILLWSSAHLIEFLVVGHSQLDVSRRYSAFLVVSCCVSCQLQDLGCRDTKTAEVSLCWNRSTLICSPSFLRSVISLWSHEKDAEGNVWDDEWVSVVTLVLS